MLRDKNLVPLSRQHQHALALCVRIDRASQGDPLDCAAWQDEIAQLWKQEFSFHFDVEERMVFRSAGAFPELQSLVTDLLEDHRRLREFFVQATTLHLTAESIQKFGQLLSQHIRREERELFQGMQSVMNTDELARLGGEVQTSLAESSNACLVPNQATRLLPGKRA